MITKEQIEALRKWPHYRHHAKDSALDDDFPETWAIINAMQNGITIQHHLRDDVIVAICDLALQALDMQPRPIADAPKDGTWILGYYGSLDRWSWCIVQWRDDGFFYNQDGIAGHMIPAKFIPLSSFPTPEQST